MQIQDADSIAEGFHDTTTCSVSEYWQTLPFKRLFKTSETGNANSVFSEI